MGCKNSASIDVGDDESGLKALVINVKTRDRNSKFHEIYRLEEEVIIMIYMLSFLLIIKFCISLVKAHLVLSKKELMSN